MWCNHLRTVSGVIVGKCISPSINICWWEDLPMYMDGFYNKITHTSSPQRYLEIFHLRTVSGVIVGKCISPSINICWWEDLPMYMDGFYNKITHTSSPQRYLEIFHQKCSFLYVWLKIVPVFISLFMTCWFYLLLRGETKIVLVLVSSNNIEDG